MITFILCGVWAFVALVLILTFQIENENSFSKNFLSFIGWLIVSLLWPACYLIAMFFADLDSDF
jgi:hypothetical protein